MSDPSSTRTIVIVGGGVIGCCSAYFLTRHPRFGRTRVLLLEGSDIAAGSSGKAGGFLAEDWHGPATSSLASLSYKLHEELASKHKGKGKWGYRKLDTVSLRTSSFLRQRRTKDNSESLAEDLMRLAPTLKWVRRDIIRDFSVLGDKSTTAQVHPHKFTNSIIFLAEERGVEVIKGTVTNIRKDASPGNTLIHVDYTPQGESNTLSITATDVIVAAGPWTSSVLPGGAPISGSRTHSVTIKPSRPVSAHAIFGEMSLSSGRSLSLEFYARTDEVYVAGAGEEDDTVLPPNAFSVEADYQKCENLVMFAGKMSRELRDGRVLVMQACYFPTVETKEGTPLIGKVPGWDGHLIVAAGHSVWGICLGPGTGKAVSELVFDNRVTCCEIGDLDPALVLTG